MTEVLTAVAASIGDRAGSNGMAAPAAPAAPAPDLDGIILIGGVAALVAAALTLVWLVMMAVLPSSAAGSGAGDELSSIAANDGAQVARFLPTTLVAFAYVPTWLGLGALLWDRAPAAAALGVAFGVLYPAVTAAGYWMQYTVVRGLAELATTDRAAARAAYEIVGFHERPTSMTFSAVILGYTLWSLAGTAVGIGLVSRGGWGAGTTGLLFLVSAGLMVLGAAGYVARNRLLSRGVLASGVTSLGATLGVGLLLVSHV